MRQQFQYNKHIKFAGGPLKYENADSSKKPPLKVIMNAIKIWKNKKSNMNAQKKLQEKFQQKMMKNMQSAPQLQTRQSESGGFTYSELQKAIFNNDIQARIILVSMRQCDLKCMVQQKYYFIYPISIYNQIQVIVREYLYNLIINIRCEHNNTALHVAFLNKDTEMIKLLLANNANPECINTMKKTPYQMVDKPYLKEIGYDPITNKFK